VDGQERFTLLCEDKQVNIHVICVPVICLLTLEISRMKSDSFRQTCCNDIEVPVLAYILVLTANLSTILNAVVR